MNSKQQGDRGVAAAIAYYTFKGFGVCVPLTDNERYDLIVDKKTELSRVQCKTTTYRKSEDQPYAVALRTCGGNRSGTGKTKNISSEECDLLFVLDGDGSAYEIPSDVFHDRTYLTLGTSKDKHKVMSFDSSALS